MKQLAALLFLTLAGCAGVPEEPVPQPQMQCALRAQVAGSLSSDYGEEVLGMGLNRAGVVELWRSEDSFTVTLTTPQGITCLIVAGEGWEIVKPKGQGS